MSFKYEADGFEKGKQRGILQSKAEGIQQGKEEASHMIALNFLNLGLSIEKVAEATGLSLSVLNNLKNSQAT